MGVTGEAGIWSPSITKSSKYGLVSWQIKPIRPFGWNLGCALSSPSNSNLPSKKNWKFFCLATTFRRISLARFGLRWNRGFKVLIFIVDLARNLSHVLIGAKPETIAISPFSPALIKNPRGYKDVSPYLRSHRQQRYSLSKQHHQT